MKVRIKVFNENATTPVYASENSAGADLYSTETHKISPGETASVRTGIAIEIPDGYVGLVCARSGLALKRGLAPANKVGVIDSDYRGEICVALYNQSKERQTVETGERVAQLVITPYLKAEFENAEELSDTLRGAGGFGSTGRK